MLSENYEIIQGCKDDTKGARVIYKRNNESCDGEIVYVFDYGNGTKFLIIKKNNSPWDSVPVSFSICWKIGMEKYCLGLPYFKSLSFDKNILTKINELVEAVNLDKE